MGSNSNKKPRKTVATKKISKKKNSYYKRFSKFSSFKKALLFAAAFALIATALLIITHAETSPYDNVRQSQLVNNPHSGLIYNGLRAVKANADHPCKGLFEVEGVSVNGKPVCTHGPDPAPDGIDVTKVTVNERLTQLAQVPQTVTTPEQLASENVSNLALDRNSGFFTNQFPISALPCTSGKYRIQLVLITHNSDNSTVIPQFRVTAQRLQSQLMYSSTHSGPGSTQRWFRFVTDSTCHAAVSTVIVPTSISLATAQGVITYLGNHGYSGTYTKYLVWDSAGDADFCAAANTYNDSQPIALKNQANLQTGYGVIAAPCWSSTAELHEMGHFLGAVSDNAPHSSGGTHCLDEHDEMCYNDGGYCLISAISVPCGVNGKAVYVAANCTDLSLQWLLDCNKNDYFNTSTSISTTNYLYNHWNIAHSPYLE
ncbi:MAG TPA: hypothetical protein VLF90_00750 [Patescibacteria group bacterium]|nr:hypothetical protein [Patescibacteria group bacterium]